MLFGLLPSFGRKEKVEDAEGDVLLPLAPHSIRIEQESLPMTEEDTRPMPFKSALSYIVCTTMIIDKILPEWAILGLVGFFAVWFLYRLWTNATVWPMNKSYLVRMLVSVVLLVSWLTCESFFVWVIAASDEKRHEYRPLQDNGRLWLQNHWPETSPGDTLSQEWFQKNAPGVKQFAAVTLIYLLSCVWDQVFLPFFF